MQFGKGQGCINKKSNKILSTETNFTDVVALKWAMEM